jgi:hypothetical protein
MPRIADTMDGMDYSLFDDEMWQKIDVKMGHMSKSRKIKNHNWEIYRKESRSDIANYLTEKLSKKLNESNITIPWSKMKAQDIINWPPDVKLMSVYRMKVKQLKKILKLVKKDQLDFSPEFLGRFKRRPISKWVLLRNQLRTDIAKYLADKLAKKLNVSRIRVPWSLLADGDIINWPSGMKFKRIAQINIRQLNRLYRQVKMDLLDFSPEFVSRFKTLRSLTNIHR